MDTQEAKFTDSIYSLLGICRKGGPTSFTSTARALLNGAPFVLSKCALAFTCIDECLGETCCFPRIQTQCESWSKIKVCKQLAAPSVCDVVSLCHRAFLTLHTAREAIQVCHPRFSGYDTFGPRGSLVKGHIQLVSLTFLLLFLLRKYRCFLSNDSKTVTAQHASTIRKNMQNE